ncbi:hypothetical protein BDW72DRAFT_213394 [Aspergillus terricola var. indicus]
MHATWPIALLTFPSQACLASSPPCLVPKTKHSLSSTSVIFQLDKNNTWFENIICIYTFPNATSLLGLTSISRDTQAVVAGIHLLDTDVAKGQIWNLDITSGEYSSDFSQSLMLPASSSSARIGVNGLKTGHSEVITSDGRAYLSTNNENRLFEVLPGEIVRLVAGGLNALTVAGLTAVTASRDGRTLYVTTNGGMSSPVSCTIVEPGKIVASKL